jgi:hypothetical protein
MALEQDIANLVEATNKLTQTVDEKMQLIDQRVEAAEQTIDDTVDLTGMMDARLQSYEDFKVSLDNSNPVIVEVGEGKQFEHPADMATHINNRGMNGEHWKVIIHPGVYTFPHDGIQGCHFHHNKHVEIVSSTDNAADVVLQNNSEHHAWLVIGDYNCHLDISHITFRDSRELTSTRVGAVDNRDHVNNNAGGIVHGVRVRYGSHLRIAHCNFNHVWHAIGLHDNSQAYIEYCVGNNVGYGLYSWRNSYTNMKRCQWTGIGDPADDSWRKGTGVGINHSSVLHANGNTIKNFYYGVASYWSSDVHFHRFHNWGGDDGRTPVDIVNGVIENCHHGVSVWYSSGGRFNHLSILNSRSHAFRTGCGSSTYANSNVTIDGADIGFYCRHNASIVANDSMVKNCTSYGFHAAYLSEIHAGSTQAHVSGNGTNYSPAASHTLGNHAGQIYFS